MTFGGKFLEKKPNPYPFSILFYVINMVTEPSNFSKQDIRRRNSCSPLGSTGSSNESWIPSKEDDSYFREKNSSEENGKPSIGSTRNTC